MICGASPGVASKAASSGASGGAVTTGGLGRASALADMIEDVIDLVEKQIIGRFAKRIFPRACRVMPHWVPVKRDFAAANNPVVKPEDLVKKTEPPKITLTGITTILGKKQALMNVDEADQRIQAAQVAVASAQENFRLAQGRFDAGVGTILELTDAQLALTQALNTEAQALSDYRIAVVRLERALGQR